VYSPLAAELWDLYAGEFKARWGMDREVAAIIGARSKSLFSAEFMESGVDSYRTSVVLPIRNAFYAASQMGERWKTLWKMSLREPLLDYGCGVGVQLLWLKRHGFNQLYGYEVPGVQRNILVKIADDHGIGMWKKGEQMETVLCTNVLEHVSDPVGLLDMLLTVGKRVIANVCMDDHEESHVAPHDELDKCREMLEMNNGLFVQRAA